MISRIIAIIACLALVPLAVSAPLRFFYQQWIAAQLAKVRDPSLVVIGDSIAAWAMMACARLVALSGATSPSAQPSS